VRRGFHEPKEKPRRFYEAVTVEPDTGGFRVRLGGRGARTPGGAALVLPAEALARQVAQEWAAQGEVIEMAEMHATRLANTAIDAIPGAREATADSVAQYAGSDLTCYFAEGPAKLAARQAEGWGPLLDRAERELGLSFIRVCGVIHQDQPPETLAKVRTLALALDDFRLAGLAFAVSLFGSSVLALAAERGWLSAAEAFEVSRIDEAWQEEQWGIDEEAAQRTARLRLEARMLDQWFTNLSQ
jgi:chaperone required for assembly of F1-ATPase